MVSKKGVKLAATKEWKGEQQDFLFLAVTKKKQLVHYYDNNFFPVVTSIYQMMFQAEEFQTTANRQHLTLRANGVDFFGQLKCTGTRVLKC